MAKLLKLTALLAAITALVWGVTIWRWQSARHLISTNDIVLYLVALPVLLFAMVLLLGWAIAKRKSAPAAPVSTGAPAAATEAPTQRPGHALVLETGLVLSIGADPATALSALAEGATQPALDDDLRDNEGFPLTTARVKDLDTQQVKEALEALLPVLAAKQPQWQGLDPSDSLVRSLALLARPLGAMVESCSQHWQAQAEAARNPQPSATAASTRKPTAGLALVWGLPQAWQEHEQALARSWLAQWLKNAAALPHEGWQLVVEPMGSAETLLLKVDQQLAAWQQEQRPGLLMALACDSLLDEAHVQRLAQRQVLCTARNPKGLVPGEAAAAALLATADWPGLDASNPALTRMHRIAMTRRDKSADAPGRIDPAMLRRAGHDALEYAGLPAADYAGLVTDADLRATRSTEVTDTVMQLLPDVDAAEQSYRLGLACGDVGLAAGLCCLALASSHAQTEKKPVLMMSAMHPHDRAAVAITPLPAPTPEPAAG